jgi:hypothetical protein
MLAKMVGRPILTGVKLILAAFLLLSVPGTATAKEKQGRIEKLIASTDGASKATAYKVKSVDEEYRILRALGLKPEKQSLIVGDDGHPYDKLTVVAEDGTKRELWFDIKSFYGGYGF